MSNGYRPHQGNRGRKESEKSSIRVPAFDDDELLGKRAEQLARNLADNSKLTTHQMRRFYGEVKRIEANLTNSSDKESAWRSNYPRIKLIKAKAVYNAYRKQNGLPKEFMQFVSQCVDRIPSSSQEGPVEFAAFCQLFEAIIGYSKEYTYKRD